MERTSVVSLALIAAKLGANDSSFWRDGSKLEILECGFSMSDETRAKTEKLKCPCT
jgi:hypothetical protein